MAQIADAVNINFCSYCCFLMQTFVMSHPWWNKPEWKIHICLCLVSPSWYQPEILVSRNFLIFFCYSLSYYIFPAILIDKFGKNAFWI